MKLVKTIFLSFLLLALPSSAGWREVDAVDFVAGGGAVMHVDDATGRHTMRAVDGVWNFGIEFASSNPNFREAGVQDAVYRANVESFGSPLMRLGAYGVDEKPAPVDGDLVNAVWDAGATMTVYKKLGAKEFESHGGEPTIRLLPDIGTTTLYHGGRLLGGKVQNRIKGFSTTPDRANAEKYSEVHGGQIFRFEVPNKFINENATRALDSIGGSTSFGIEYHFNGRNTILLNDFMIK